MIFIIGLHALDWSNRFKTEKYCAGKSFEILNSLEDLHGQGHEDKEDVDVLRKPVRH